MQVEFPRLGGAAPVVFWVEARLAALVFRAGHGGAEFGAKRGAAGTVDGFSVDFQPGPHFSENRLTGRGDLAVGVGADVEQIVASLANDIYKFETNILGSLPVLIVLLVSPGVVNRGGGLPRARGDDVGDFVVAARLIILQASGAEAAVDEGIGLDTADQLDEARATLGGHQVRRIEPDQADGSVVGEQLAHLWQRLVTQIAVEVLLVIRLEVPVVAGAVRLVPILRLRVVETEFDIAFGAGRLEFLEGIAVPGGGVVDIVGAHYGTV